MQMRCWQCNKLPSVVVGWVVEVVKSIFWLHNSVSHKHSTTVIFPPSHWNSLQPNGVDGSRTWQFRLHVISPLSPSSFTRKNRFRFEWYLKPDYLILLILIYKKCMKLHTCVPDWANVSEIRQCWILHLALNCFSVIFWITLVMLCTRMSKTVVAF